MTRKFSALVLSLLMILALGGCKNAKEVYSSGGVISEPQQVVDTRIPNPLTGLKMDPSLENNRPVAVMINNIRVAQSVQTGLNSFDILYETEVEGGITRMMGVTKNIAAMPQIGTVRSARYVYLDLALGHGAVYVHGGFDGNYFAAHKKELGVSTIDVNGPNANYGMRQKNGLSSEHTLYTSGEKLNKALDDLEYKRTTDKNTWISFADEAAPVTPAASCVKVSVPFSNSYVTGFTYDAATGKYTKNSGGTERTDYLTGEKLSVKNIFVLFTNIYPYSDNYHMKVELNGGTGYYVSNGGYEEIKWQKGSANESLTFSKADGSELVANAGNSYICIVNDSQESAVKFTAAEPTTPAQ